MPKTGVHKDFHGAFSFGLIHLEEHYGAEAVRDYLRQMAPRVFGPLIEAIRTEGLSALEAHWRHIMELEEADYELRWDGNTLILEVRVCPALEHIRSVGYPESPMFCEHTCIVNSVICEAAGFETETDYDQAAAHCVQRFRPKGGAR